MVRQLRYRVKTQELTSGTDNNCIIPSGHSDGDMLRERLDDW